MAYNLTENQKKLARFLVEQVQAGNLSETFEASESMVRQRGLELSEARYGMHGFARQFDGGRRGLGESNARFVSGLLTTYIASYDS